MSDVTPIRDPKTDSLLTRRMVLTLIDYQREQYAGVGSVGYEELRFTSDARSHPMRSTAGRVEYAYVKHACPARMRSCRRPARRAGDRPHHDELLGGPGLSRGSGRTRTQNLITRLWTEVCVAFRPRPLLRGLPGVRRGRCDRRRQPGRA